MNDGVPSLLEVELDRCFPRALLELDNSIADRQPSLVKGMNHEGVIGATEASSYVALANFLIFSFDPCQESI